MITLAGASFIMGLSRGGLSGGVALLGVLLAAQVLEPIDAAAFLLPILVLTDPISIWLYRKHVDKGSLKVLLPGLVVGLVVGYFAVTVIEGDSVRLLVGLLAIALVADGIRSRVAGSASRVLPPAVGGGLGVLAGFTSFLIHSGLPPVAAYLLPKKMTREVFLGTTAVFFSIANVSKIVPYHYLGLYSTDQLGLSVKMLPLAFLGVAVARVINKMMTDGVFYFIVYACILLLGIRQVLLFFA